MSKNYIVINGKKAELTEEQMRALGIETRKNPFERVEKGKEYYCINTNGEIYNYGDVGDLFDNSVYVESNYFNDKAFAKQVALHELLYRKLLKFAYDNEYEDTDWNNENDHWLIFYDSKEKDFFIDSSDGSKIQGVVYFSSTDGAEHAIKEVIEPFMKKHPEFIW